MTSGTPLSIPGLLKDLRDETTTLLRQEAALAKEELSAKASQLMSQAVQMAVGGGVVAIGGLLLLFGVADLIAMLLIQAGLSEPAADWVSRVGLGVLAALTGWLLIAKAKKRFSATSLAPQQTLQSLQENKQWAQAKLHSSP